MATSFTGHAAHSLPSPALSQATSNADGTGLPTARSHPLRPGSQKETAFITYADAKILNINRRYAKKFSGEDDGGSGRGYESFAEVVSDLEAVFDVVWVSGTRMLRCSYFLSVKYDLILHQCLVPFPTSSRMLTNHYTHAVYKPSYISEAFCISTSALEPDIAKSNTADTVPALSSYTLLLIRRAISLRPRAYISDGREARRSFWDFAAESSSRSIKRGYKTEASQPY